MWPQKVCELISYSKLWILQNEVLSPCCLPSAKNRHLKAMAFSLHFNFISICVWSEVKLMKTRETSIAIHNSFILSYFILACYNRHWMDLFWSDRHRSHVCCEKTFDHSQICEQDESETCSQKLSQGQIPPGAAPPQLPFQFEELQKLHIQNHQGKQIEHHRTSHSFIQRIYPKALHPDASILVIEKLTLMQLL